MSGLSIYTYLLTVRSLRCQVVHAPFSPPLLFLCDVFCVRWLQHPLVDVEKINRRQAMVETLCGEKALMDTLQKGAGMLRGMPGKMRT